MASTTQSDFEAAKKTKQQQKQEEIKKIAA
jgi:hypothetical protein